jgi:hypothetical protein
MNRPPLPAIRDPEACADPTTYRVALDELRRFTRSGPDRSPLSVLLRTVAISRAAAKAVLRSELRTKAQRRDAIIVAAAAIATERDDRKAA